MPVQTPSTFSIIPPKQSSGGSLKNSASAIRYQGQSRDDDDLWAAVAKALDNGQNQIDQIVSAMRANIALPDPIQITDPGGAIVAQIGHMLGSDNASYPGIYARNIYIGGSGFPNEAPLFSNGIATIIGKNGIVEIQDAYGNIGAFLGTQSEATQAVTGAVASFGLIRLTVAAHGYRNGDWVNVTGVGGVPNATGQWLVNVPDANHLDLLGSVFAGVYTAGGLVNRFFAGGAFEQIAVAAGQRITNVQNNGSGLIRVTVPANGYKTGYVVIITNVNGVPGANGEFTITRINANDFDLIGSTFSGAYINGGVSINWPTAKLLAQGDGSLLLQNVDIIVIGPGGEVITIDSSGFNITSTNSQVNINSSSFTASDIGDLSELTFGVSGGFGDPTFGLKDTAGTTRVQFSTAIGWNFYNSLGVQQVRIIADPGGTVTLDSVGDINTSGIYRVGGVAGITGSLSLSLGTDGTAVRGLAGVGQTNFTAVTSVTLTSNTFSGGLRTT